MTHAYSELYLDDVMSNMGAMMEFGTRALGYSIEELYDRFLASNVPVQIAKANPQYLAGYSGTELTYRLLEDTGETDIPHYPCYVIEAPGMEYWTGWALAYIQWNSGYSFQELNRCGVNAKSLSQLYNPLHEADISKVYDVALDIIGKSPWHNCSKLKHFRTNAGLTQGQLAERSGVSLRMIRAYEQKKQDLKRAEAASVLSLAKVLGCKVEDLLQ